MQLFTFVLSRARYQWRRLSAVALGILLATTLLAATPILLEVALDFGLRYTLQSAPSLAARVRLTRGLADETLAAADAAARRTIAHQLGEYAGQTIAAGSARPLYAWRSDSLVSDEQITLSFYDRDVARFENHVAWLAGGWPDNASLSASLKTRVVPVVIGRALAETFGLDVGDRLPASSTLSAVAPELWYEVAGILEERDPAEAYWSGNDSPLRTFSDGRLATETSVLLPPAYYAVIAAGLFPDGEIQLAWHVLLDYETLHVADAPVLAHRIASWRAEAARAGTETVSSTADETLLTYAAEADVVRAPIALIILISVTLGFYYIVLINAMGLRQIQPELALLAGRGVSGQRVILWSVVEIGVIALLASIAAVPLGQLAVSALARWGPLATVRDPSWALPLPARAWLAAATGGVVAIAAAVTPLAPIWRRSLQVTRLHLHRPARDPWWMRSYLDVMLLLTGGVLAWRARLSGAFIGASSDGGMDWLLVLSPVLLLVGAAVLLLRLFPLLSAGLAEVAARWPGLPPVLALRHTARRPHEVARLLLLLALAIALGLFATALDRTLARNEAERARYVAVGDMRLSLVGAMEEDVPADYATATWRSEGALGATLRAGSERFTVLAVDPESFNPVATYRDDFATEPVAAQLAGLQASLPDMYNHLMAVPIAGKPDKLTLRVWVEPEVRAVAYGFAFDLKLRTARQQSFTVRLTAAGVPDTNGWVRFTGKVPKLAEADYPLALTSFWWRTNHTIFIYPDRPPVIDTLRSHEGATSQQVTDFEAAEGRYWFTTYAGMFPYFAARHAYKGQSGLGMALRYENTSVGLWYGFNLILPGERAALPVLVTPQFAEATGSDVGHVVSIRVRGTGSGAWTPIAASIEGIVDYFPSLDDELPAGSVITLREPLLRLVNAYQQPLAQPNELIVVGADPEGIVPFTAAATTVWEATAVERELRANPLALGLRAMTLFGAVVTTVLSLAGFTTHFLLWATEQARGYSVLRALGLSVRQLYATLFIEQLLLIGSALAFGTALGLGLTRLALTNLPFQLGAVSARPPFVPVIDWVAVGVLVAGLAITFGAALLATTASLWRADLHRALRIGEE